MSRDALVAAYHTYGRPSEGWLVGAEFERHLLRPDGAPLPYDGPHGVKWLLEQLTHIGWRPHYEGPNPIALERDGAWVTLEPGGQFELSGAPHTTIRGVLDESAAFVEEVQAALGDAPVTPIALGYTPFAAVADITWMPKGRYVTMREHLGRTGALAHNMMKGTAALQASFDFADEADCARKVQLATRLGPLTTAMFANSPLLEGRPSGFASFRGHVWTQTDPLRTGFPDAGNHFTFEAWVDYLLDVPMMFTCIGGVWASAGGRTFRDWTRDGIDGVYPTDDDWELHLTSVFPEVRTKRTIEVRGADCVSLALSGAFVALFKGLFYCGRAMDGAEELADRFTHAGTRDERFDAACQGGLQGQVGGRPLAAWAEDLLEIAHGGISRCDPDDVPFLAPLEAQVASGNSPAHDLLAAWSQSPTWETVRRHGAYHPL